MMNTFPEKSLSKKEILFHGIPISPGIRIGRVFRPNLKEQEFPDKISGEKIGAEQTSSEIARFQKAVDVSIEEIKKLENDFSKKTNAQDGSIFSVHLEFIQDRENGFIASTVDNIQSKLISAEDAFILSVHDIISKFFLVDNSIVRERIQDIKDVATRIYGNLTGNHEQSIELKSLPENAVVVAKDVTPSQIAEINKENLAGVTTLSGSKTSHTSILARAIGIPAVANLKNLFSYDLQNGDEIIVDGLIGLVILHPCADTVSFYREKILKREKVLHKFQQNVTFVPETKDGYRVKITANIDKPDDIGEALKFGISGVGLFRTEFLYLHRGALPSEELQFQTYSMILKSMKNSPVTIRTYDIGGDKICHHFEYKENNPFLGLRAIRLHRYHPDLLRIQLRALMRASIHGKLKIMFPMLTNAEELNQLLQLKDEIANELNIAHIPYSSEIQYGAMIEVPSAALVVEQFADKLDFFSIGTNDLAQYTLATDRTNENISYLYQPEHASVLRLIHQVVSIAKKSGIPVCVCGEMAGVPIFTPILVGLGVDQLSMAPSSFATVSSLIRKLSMYDAEKLAEYAMNSVNPTDSLMKIREHIQAISPEINTLFI